ncbi:His-Xaa-Ser system protein HxsD [Candidatus Gracilibacteria bacterium]|nr:His-Xaa-Ser system protein HxsD [Candidatus Gracilibacteria bacterium]
MSHFITQIENQEGFELLIDTHIFSKDIILKAAYNLLDQAYFFFKYDSDNNIILECRKKEGINIETKIVLGEYSDELLNVYLRDKLEKENKIIREAIVLKALNGPLDYNNFISLDTDNNTSHLDELDTDIDQILQDLDNDSLPIDESEIDQILQELGSDSTSVEKPTFKIDPASFNDAKKMFKKENLGKKNIS